MYFFFSFFLEHLSYHKPFFLWIQNVNRWTLKHYNPARSLSVKSVTSKNWKINIFPNIGVFHISKLYRYVYRLVINFVSILSLVYIIRILTRLEISHYMYHEHMQCLWRRKHVLLLQMLGFWFHHTKWLTSNMFVREPNFVGDLFPHLIHDCGNSVCILSYVNNHGSKLRAIQFQL